MIHGCLPAFRAAVVYLLVFVVVALPLFTAQNNKRVRVHIRLVNVAFSMRGVLVDNLTR